MRTIELTNHEYDLVKITLGIVTQSLHFNDRDDLFENLGDQFFISEGEFTDTAVTLSEKFDAPLDFEE